MIDEVSFLADSLGIYSPTGKEERFASFLEKKVVEAGFSVQRDTAGNVIASTGKGGKKVLLCCHMDTVPGFISVREEDGRVYGRGASDAKGPLCSFFLASLPFIDSKEIRLTLAFVTREEGDSLGINTLIKKGEKYDYAIFGEPSGCSRIVIGYRGRVGFWLKARTEGGHAGSPWAHKSALEKTVEAIGMVRSLEKKYSGKDNYHSLSVCPTILKAGSYKNVVPAKASAYLDVRIPPSVNSQAVISEILRIARGLASDGSNVYVRFDEPTEPYEVDINSLVVRALQRAIIISIGKKPIFVRKTGTGDMNTFAHLTGTQSTTYGPGISELSHTNKEYIEVEDYLASIKVLGEALKQVSSLSSTQAQ
jgi:LysW-gamma-L-lysine carboxypeptidase